MSASVTSVQCTEFNSALQGVIELTSPVAGVEVGWKDVQDYTSTVSVQCNTSKKDIFLSEWQCLFKVSHLTLSSILEKRIFSASSDFNLTQF